ncbi:hypothetical protein [Mycolicibacterium baixiangningiae]|uniref:hypothetical protein n=1 Tax=Mycolicibacterium baixiangningiae TaxID=2761578 RepID=UPI0018D06017|nr:hypothetical protein [Mycolicibacterium baixiangningiae]
MTSNVTTTTSGSVASRPGDGGQALVPVHDVAHRFVQTYGQTQIDPNFAALFAETVEVWHNFDDETMTLPGGEFAGAMLRMLSATAEIVHGHSDLIWSLQIGDDGFALAATASGDLNGLPMHIARCLLVTVHNGRITRICEFGDRQQRAPLDEALRAADKFRC